MARACLRTGRSYRYLDERPAHGQHGATLLCIHGFPDLPYGWRLQIPPWVAQGYRVIAPDMLGYGETDMPLEASAYSTKRLCDDLAALLDHLGVDKAVVIGHDWGSYTAGRFALWYPQRLLALVMLSTPYTPPTTYHKSVDEMVRLYRPFSYQLYFASEESTAEIEAHLPLFFRQLYKIPSQKNLPLSRIGALRERLLSGKEPDGCLLSDKDLEHYTSNFKRGMIGPLSYYRTTKTRFEEERDAGLPSNLRADLPVLFIYGTEDTTCPPTAVGNLSKFIDQLKVVPLPGVGHWVLLEAPERVAELVLQWVGASLRPRVSPRL